MNNLKKSIIESVHVFIDAGRSAILEDSKVGMFEQITAITDGLEKTVATCKIFSLPTTSKYTKDYISFNFPKLKPNNVCLQNQILDTLLKQKYCKYK